MKVLSKPFSEMVPALRLHTEANSSNLGLLGLLGFCKYDEGF